MSILRRRAVVVLVALVSALVLPVGGVVLAEDPPHHLRDRVTQCCWFEVEPRCYLCNDHPLYDYDFSG